ncbi:hypothetical protein SynA18461_00490 [Synechococcus sp. A18-46.1]|nr:hypothetical protein SynA18461_00490 [Synechococcus sp. A18-46.1]
MPYNLSVISSLFANFSSLISPYNFCSSSLPYKIQQFSKFHFFKLFFSALKSTFSYFIIDLSRLTVSPNNSSCFFNENLFSPSLYIGTVKLTDNQIIQISQKLDTEYLVVFYFNFDCMSQEHLLSVHSNFSDGKFDTCDYKVPLFSYSVSLIFFSFIFFCDFLRLLSLKAFCFKFLLKSLLSFPFYFDKSCIRPFHISRFVSSFFSNISFSSVIISLEGEPYEFRFVNTIASSLTYDTFNLYFPSPFFPLDTCFAGPLYHFLTDLKYTYIFIPSQSPSYSLQSLINDSPLCSIKHDSIVPISPRTDDLSLFLKVSSCGDFSFLILPEASIYEVRDLLLSVIQYCRNCTLTSATLFLKPHPSSSSNLIAKLEHIVPSNFTFIILPNISSLLDNEYSAICHSGSTAPMLFTNSSIPFISFPSSNGYYRDCYSTQLYRLPKLSFYHDTFNISTFTNS